MDFNLIDGLLDAGEKLLSFFDELWRMILSVTDSLKQLLEMLNSFDESIVAMAESCGGSEFAGMPIMESIGMFRYLVGDVAFMMIYFSILVGCLLTIYKLVVLLYDSIDSLVMQSYGVSSKNFFSNLIGKIFDKNIY